METLQKFVFLPQSSRPILPQDVSPALLSSHELSVDVSALLSCLPAGLIPRQYQLQALQYVSQRNGIVFLDTGSGKTFIASLLILYLTQARSLSLPAVQEQPKKRPLSVFMVTTINLLEQQAKTLSTQTGLRVEPLLQENESIAFFDQASKSNWDQFFSKIDVAVMVGPKLLYLLRHGFLHFEDIELIVFDECHHCSGNHAYALVMREFYFRANGSLPRILGLTASPIKTKLSSFLSEEFLQVETMHQIQSLSRILDSNFVPIPSYETFCATLPQPQLILYISEMRKSSSPTCYLFKHLLPKLITAIFQEVYKKEVQFEAQIEALSELQSCILSLFQDALATDQNCIINGRRPSQCHLDQLSDQDTQLLQFLHSFFKNAISLIRELGPIGFLLLALEFIPSFTQNPSSNQKQVKLNKIGLLFQTACDKCQSLFAESLLSSKVDKLLSNLTSLATSRCFKGIVFVTQRVVGYYLSALFSYDERCRQAGIRPQFVSGACRSKIFRSIAVDSPEDDLFGFRHEYVGAHIGRTQQTHQRGMIEHFRQDEFNLLVATGVVEQGFDVAACNLVFSFNSFVSVKSFIQMRGRARAHHSRFFILVPSHQKEEATQQVSQTLKCISHMNDFRKALLKNPPQCLEKQGLATPPEECVVVPETQALLTEAWAQILLRNYCYDRATYLRLNYEPPSFVYSKEQGGVHISLKMPEYCSEIVSDTTMQLPIGTGKERAKQKICFQIGKMLIKKGEINPHLIWQGRAPRNMQACFQVDRDANSTSVPFYRSSSIFIYPQKNEK